MLEKYPHITQQQAWPWIWENVDALYTLTNQIPAWVVDDTVMAIWVSGKQGLLNSYTNWDSKNREAGMALMLSRAPSCLRVETDLQGKKVYSTVVMFVHPKQELFTIKEGQTAYYSLQDNQMQMLPSCVNYQAINMGDFILVPSTTPIWSCRTVVKRGNQNSFAWISPYVTTINSWFTACIGGRGNMVTWHSCHLYSQQILPFLSYFQSGILAHYGIMTSTTRRLLQVVPEWWLYVPPSVGSHVAIWK